MTAGLRPLESLVPHSGAMVLIGEPYEELSNGARATVRIAEDSRFYCPGLGVPSWVGIEYMAQTVALHAGLVAARHGREIKIGFLLGTRRYTAETGYFRLGSELSVEAAEEWQDGHMAVYACRLTDRDGAELAVAELNVFQPEDATEFIGGSDQ